MDENMARAFLVSQTAIGGMFGLQKSAAKEAAFNRLEGVSMMGARLLPKLGWMALRADLRSDVLGSPTW
jgi:hypothetical protein